ncbi:MAG TPA: hypothetical protein PKD17_02565 [Cellvibrionaceae bacterium]|nr:hypothetical protein [Cellvibrionaceae bacterium]HMW70673.1 hypothetical protein [Cellvibrionaceae bacterium]HMY40111.1 hypothetical protein [Marinagarivorans sp.]HNG60574.1 hypothetical protein [Cellvibrionaceae bacterium]
MVVPALVVVAATIVAGYKSCQFGGSLSVSGFNIAICVQPTQHIPAVCLAHTLCRISFY